MQLGLQHGKLFFVVCTFLYHNISETKDSKNIPPRKTIKNGAFISHLLRRHSNFKTRQCKNCTTKICIIIISSSHNICTLVIICILYTVLYTNGNHRVVGNYINITSCWEHKKLIFVFKLPFLPVGIACQQHSEKLAGTHIHMIPHEPTIFH